jgi:hypothetical protein
VRPDQQKEFCIVLFPSLHPSKRWHSQAGNKTTRSQQKRRGLRPLLEALEDRALPSASIPLNSTSWTPIGPASLFDGSQSDSGRITAIAADPTNANVLYIGAADGGVWKTANAGVSWTPLTDNQGVLFMGALAVAPSNPNVIYAGTGEANFGPSKQAISRVNIYYGDGVLKSTDGGSTWVLEGNALFNRRTISRIVVDPANASTVYVAVGAVAVNGLAGNTGIWKSTDGGATWTDTTSTISTTDAFSDLAMDPTNNQILYAAVGNPSGDAANGIYKSTNAGGSWSLLSNFPNGATDTNVGRITLAISTTSDLTLYASIAHSGSNASLYKMEKTTDGGNTWSQLTSTPNYMGSFGDYNTSLAVDPTNASIVYAGGQAGTNSLIRSANGGSTWTDIGNVAGGPHVDHHAATFDANGKFLDGNDGGIWRLDNPSPAQWTNLNSNLNTIQFQSLALDPVNPNVAYGGAQDNGTDKFTGNAVWSEIEGGDGAHEVVSFANTQVVYHDAAVASFGASDFIRKSTDGGNTWTSVTTGINAGSEPSDFYPPIVMDPTNANRLLVGTNRVYETTNAAGLWAPISTPGSNGWTATAAIDAIATSGSTVYATAGGHLFVTFNDGASWSQADIPGYTDHFNDLVIDPFNTSVAYAVRDRFSAGPGGHVFMTTNGGVSWTDISLTLPNYPADSLALDDRTHTVFVGNDIGIYATQNGGASWAPFGAGLPNAQVPDLQVNTTENILGAATYGRGAWEISLANWKLIGPAPVVNGQEVAGSTPASGRVVGLAADPTNASIIYAAISGGGVWKTTNGGTSWIPLTDNQATTTMGAIAVAPSNPSIMYAGTGEANNSGDSYYGRGVLKSTDGGQTWTLLTGNAGVNEFDRKTISKIAVDPANANIVYVALARGGTNGASTSNGIFKTTDGGVTWTNTTANISTTAFFTDVLIDPSNDQNIFMAIGTYNGNSANAVYKSTNAGGSWALAGNFPTGSADGNIKLAIAKSNSQILYAAIAGSGQSGSTSLGALYKLMKTTDGGATWTQLTSAPQYMDGQGWYDNTLAIDPTNANIVYAGGSYNGGGAGFIQTTNGGGSWTDIGRGAAGDNGIHTDDHALTFDASGLLLDGNDGGIWKLDNPAVGSIHWTNLNGNLSTLEFIGIALDPNNPNIVYGGTQDNGTLKTTGSLGWNTLQGGDGGFVRVDQSNPSTIYHTFTGDGAGFFKRSDDGGTTWATKTTGINADPSNFYVPYVVDPSNSARLVLGTNRVYETTNRGDLWAPISTVNANGWTTNNSIDALAIAPSNPSTIYATAGGHILVTFTDGASWNLRDISGFTDHFSYLAIDPSNNLVAYVVRDRFSTGSGGHVFKTVDGGTTWTDISGNLPAIPADSIALDARTGVIYVGVDTGIYASNNGGTSWSLLGTGLPNVRVHELVFNAKENVLAAGTYGRSVWEYTVAHFSVTTSLSTVAAGTLFSVTVTALDPFNTLIAGYTGTVHFTSSDGLAGLPGDYTFTAADNGTHTFTGVFLRTLGIQTLSAADRVNSLVAGTATLTVIAPAWDNFGHDPQHTGVSSVASQPIDTIHWQTSVDLNPTGANVHYGSPVITPANTVIIPVKTGTNGGFELTARNGANGTLMWTQTSDYTLPPFSWMPPYGPALTSTNRLYFPGNGGTVYYINNPDSPGATISGQLAFYGLANYQANPSAYNSTVMIDTPITADNFGNIYFGFMVTGANPSNLVGGGIARIDANGNSKFVLASTAANDAAITRVPLSASPALSNDGSVLYVSVNNTNQNYGYLLGLDSTTLATKYMVFLKDPRNNNANNAQLVDQSTATPMVAPDGTVFYGIFGNPFNGSRGFLLHFSADLTQEFTAGAFGWDDTQSIVPASMVPSYHGSSLYLIFSKYNNYVAAEVGSTGGDGVNKIAILDPYATEPDPNNDGDSNLMVMKEVLTIAGPTPDTSFTGSGFPNAVREWCINDTAVDPFTKSVLVNSEDGSVYRWDLTTNTLTQAVNITPGIGEPYTPTAIGPDGTVYAINGGTLFALGGFANYTLTDVASANPALVGSSITFNVTVASTSGGPTPTGTITFKDGSTVLATVTLTNGLASYTTSALTAAHHFITAAYSGGGSYAAGSTTLVEAVLQATTTAVVSSANPSQVGQSVTFTATVTPSGPTANVPGGVVTFLDGAATLGTALLSSTGTATFTTSSLGAGNHSITVTFAGDSNFTGSTSPALSQTVTAATHFTVTAPSSVTAGSAFTIAVTALDAGNNVVTNYQGTVHFTTTDMGSGVALPADYTFQAGDNGVHTFTNGVVLVTAGSQTLTATDTAITSITGSASVPVNPGAAASLVVTGFPTTITAGVAGSFIVTARDNFGNTATGYAGTVHFSSSDAQATLPANASLTNGTRTFSATLKTASTQSLTATDTVTSSIGGTQSNITVNPAAAKKFMVSGFPSPVMAGVAGSFTVVAKDAFNNMATGYTGTVHFTSSDTKAVLPANYTFVAADSGTHTFSATLKTAATQSITATDTVSGTTKGSQTGIVVQAAATAQLPVTGFPSPVVAGTPGSFTVTAKDAFGNKTTGYLGTVHFTSSDTKAALPANYTFVAADNGVHVFTNGATLFTAGAKTITATDTLTSTITGRQTVQVVAAAPQSLVVSGYPSPTVAGVSHSFTVTAKDAYGNVATGYVGTVHLSSSDPQAVLPADYTFVATDKGKHVFSATLKTAATQSITATDTVTAAFTSTQSGIVVNAAAASVLVVSGFPLSITAGTAASFTVTAKDTFGNIATGYRGTVHFTSSDAAAVLPANYTFVATDKGKRIFSATLKTRGTQSITATDTVTAAITGTESGIMVAGATLDEPGWPLLPDSDDAEAVPDVEDSNEPLPRALLLADAVASPLPGGLPMEQEVAAASLALVLAAPGWDARRRVKHWAGLAR